MPMPPPPENEDDCTVCGAWPKGLREQMRNGVTEIPLKKPMCEACLMAWWQNTVRFHEARRRADQ